MKQVVLSYPNQQTQEILLLGVPRVGEHIRLQNGVGLSSRSLAVIGVQWVESPERGSGPSVLVFVQESK
jgi:hypothetical protein